jgi:uncharacterized protein YoxC
MHPVATTALVVLAVVSLLWTVLLVAVLLELRRLSWRLQEFIRTLELDLRPVLQEAREGVRTAAKAAQEVADGTARLRGTMAALQDAGDNIRVTTDVIRAVVGSRLIPVASVLAGLRVGVNTLWRRYRRRRESS